MRKCLKIILMLSCVTQLALSAYSEEAPTVEAEAVDAEAVPEVESPATVEPETAVPAKDWISGRFTTSSDTAWSDSSRDFDLDQTLRLKMDPPGAPRLHFYGSLWLHEDLDGDEAQDSALYDIDNAYDHDVRARLAHLYMQADDLWGNSELRVGRQRILDSPLYPRIDGLFFKQNNAQWDWYAFVGARASLYQDAHSDFSTGAGVAWRPTTRTKVALDFAYMEEDNDKVERGFVAELLGWHYPYEVSEEISTAYFALSLHQALGENVWGYARFTMYDDDPNEIFLDISGYAPGADLTYTLSYRRQLERVTDQVNGTTVYYQELGAQENYDHFLASVYKPVSEKVAVSLESELHLSSSDYAYDNNRDYWRMAAALHLMELKPGLDLELSLERWDADRGSASWVVTGELSKEWGKWTWNLGADYEQYRDEVTQYNPRPEWANQFAILFIPGYYSRPFTPLIWYLDEPRVRTREEIHSVYTGVEYDVNDKQKLSAKVTYESDDSNESPYWRIETSYAIDF